MNVNLVFNQDYKTFQGSYAQKCKIVGENPNPIGLDKDGNEVKGFTVDLPTDVVLNYIKNDEIVASMAVPKGQYLASARGGQYNSEVHRTGNETSISFYFSEGQDNVGIALLPGDLIIGKKIAANLVFSDKFEVVND